MRNSIPLYANEQSTAKLFNVSVSQFRALALALLAACCGLCHFARARADALGRGLRARCGPSGCRRVHRSPRCW